MKSRKFSYALLGATALSVFVAAAPASAQRIDEIYAFGDSYADDNNALQLGLIPAPFQPLYPTGRFTGGTNYIDTLSELLDAPVYNFAIGGARATPDFLTEVGAFSAGGGFSVFPAVSTELDETDLVTVSIGGNDARAYGSLPGASVAGAAAAAVPAINATAAGLDVLVEAGAQTISFLAGDTGQLPEALAIPASIPIRTAYSTAFNQGVQQVLAGYAEDGVIVHYLDGALLLAQVSADLDAYGLTGIACPAFPNQTCLISGSNNYLFYGDLLHPTSAGSAIIARYIATQLQAPLTLGGPSELALDAAEQFGRTLGSRLNVDEGGEGIKLFLVGDSLSRDVHQDDSTDQFDVDSVGVTGGLTYGFGNATVGLALNYSRPRARFNAEVAETKTDSYRAGVFGGMEWDGPFVQAYAGVGEDRHELRRNGVVNSVRAEADGSHVVAGAEAGYLVPMGAFRVGPAVSLDYAKAKVDAYTEEGDAVLNLNVSSVSARSLEGSVGVQARGELDSGGMRLSPFVALAVEKDLLGDGRSVRFSQTSAPVIVNRWDLGENSKQAYARVTGGASAAVIGSIDINALVSSTFGHEDGDELSVHVGARMGF